MLVTVVFDTVCDNRGTRLLLWHYYYSWTPQHLCQPQEHRGICLVVPWSNHVLYEYVVNQVYAKKRLTLNSTYGDHSLK